MTQLGLGLAALGRPEYLTIGHSCAVDGRFDPAALEQHCHAVLDAAWDSGIRHFDVARSYGLAEQFLGSWLSARPNRREELVIGSKWGYAYVADFQRGAEVHEVKEHSVARLAEQWPQTVRDLGGKPDHYLIHSVTPDSPALRDAALLDDLRALAAGGTRIGISTSGPHQADVVRAALEIGVFDSVQSTWNPLEPSVAPALAEAHEAGWFVVVKEAMANGRLVAENSELAASADSAGVGRDALALAVALAQPWADVVLSGAATVAQLEQNIAALSIDRAVIAPGDLTIADLDIAEPPRSYWDNRSRMGWT
ncbi:aryl-alcohol dehydrogenase-like predicted oxidoreductase [Rhodococcus fascians]|uniref:aldo/keto reductase n=1 Tax=Nocardiaceae TaxID=85025 RepID=UPI00070B71C0|nr:MULTISPECIES: aldo/keto reductase [Rhodococcus]KQU32423.1 aldo/keto reductase [Rhodococcus sp. Leaf233]MDR6909025.1 aryl-alcohol dehydrogenase-like predicted oxidoreductase [Rhodococcus sp. 3258]MDR6930158.1 aryl-alcohol dehydrogenase-like predicted oxidoreductase [Rhodococcus fascians]